MLMFAFPDGLQIRDQSLRVINDPQPTRSVVYSQLPPGRRGICKYDCLYSFILTDERGERRYCSVLLFHQKHFARG